jgi:hypothetical protein
MKLVLSIAAAVTFSIVDAQNNTAVTWLSTSLISEAYSSSITVKYGNSPVTPVPTSTAPIVIVTSYISKPAARKNINWTTWSTVIVTESLEQRWDIVYTTGTPPTVTVNGTSTDVVWTSPTVATVTFAPTTCINSAETPKSTVTKYSGEYKPFLGQVTTTKTSWPTAVTFYYFLTASYHVYTFIGSTVTTTSTATGTTYLSTTVVGTKTMDFAAGGRYYTRTRYSNTVTHTSSDHQLAYMTKPVGVVCDTAATAATVTYAARCAPTNLIDERDQRGVEIRLLPKDWSFPLGFPNTVIGVPGLDASACCQLCLDNEGCAISEWTIRWSGACRLYFYNSP